MIKKILSEIGLNETQVDCYLNLLNDGPGTALTIANRLKIKRTTAFMALDRLKEMKLVDQPSKNYEATSPENIKKIISDQSLKIQQTGKNLSQVFPSLLSQYKLSHKRPGIIYKDGLEGLKTLFDDIIKTNEEILIMPSDFDRLDRNVSKFIDQQIMRQQLSGIKVRVIYPSDLKDDDQQHDLNKKNIKLIRFGEKSYSSQIVIYGDKVAITNFQPEILTMIVVNADIAKTHRAIFDNIWNSVQS